MREVPEGQGRRRGTTAGLSARPSEGETKDMKLERGDPSGLAKRCHGSGMLICRCMGDGCCCGFHGEAECFGCVDCEDEDDYDEDRGEDEVSQ
jgi:hypothetical protein